MSEVGAAGWFGALPFPEPPMTIARRLATLLLVGSIGGCATVGARTSQPAVESPATGAEDALELLRLVEYVEAAALR